jgi:hypothetical protein
LNHHLPLSVRVLAVLAAICLVASFAIALLLPPSLSLAQVIARADHTAMVRLQGLVRDGLGEWSWRSLAIPILARPGWLTPLAIGLLLGGAAVSMASRAMAPRSRHRRP